MNSSAVATITGYPQFWWMLSDVDKYKYGCLKFNISTKAFKSQRNKRIETFTEILNAIKGFVLQGDKDDTVRGLVCGICWLHEGIAINTHQLRYLISKCKSSINGSLQKMGYTTSLGRTEAGIAMSNAFPILKDNNTELRKWTVRRRDNDTDIPVLTPNAINNASVMVPLINGRAKNVVEQRINSPSPNVNIALDSNKPTNGYFAISLDGIAKAPHQQQQQQITDINKQQQQSVTYQSINMMIGNDALLLQEEADDETALPSFISSSALSPAEDPNSSILKNEEFIEDISLDGGVGETSGMWLGEPFRDDLNIFFADEPSLPF